jgi:hypothetical protein
MLLLPLPLPLPPPPPPLLLLLLRGASPLRSKQYLRIHRHRF